MNQPSRCNAQEGLLSVVQTGWLWSPGRQSTPNSKLGKLFICKKPHYQHVTYGLQSDWLHVCKAILLVQTSRATCLQSNSIGTNGAGFCSNLGARGLFSSLAGFHWVHIDWPAPGHPMGAGNPTISRETETQVPAACQPQPRQPHTMDLLLEGRAKGGQDTASSSQLLGPGRGSQWAWPCLQISPQLPLCLFSAVNGSRLLAPSADRHRLLLTLK